MLQPSKFRLPTSLAPLIIVAVHGRGSSRDVSKDSLKAEWIFDVLVGSLRIVHSDLNVDVKRFQTAFAWNRNVSKIWARRSYTTEELACGGLLSHARAVCGRPTISPNATSARSHPARSTSQCVTNRTEYVAVSNAQISFSRNRSHNSTAFLPVPSQSKITIFVFTFAGSIFNPGIAAIPFAKHLRVLMIHMQARR